MPRPNSRFNSNPSPEYEAIVKAFQSFAAKNGLLDAQKAYGEATSLMWKEEFAHAKGWTMSQATPCIQKVLGKRCGLGVSSEGCECHPPGHDHFTMWNKDGEPVAYSFQPYSLDASTLEELCAFSKRNGLNFSITNLGAWYFPGSAFMILMQRA